MDLIKQTYPDDLKVLLSEWLIYTALNRYNFEMSWNEDIPQGLSDAEMFETCALYPAYNRIYGDVSWFLYRLKIVKSGQDEDHAICKYNEIPDRIRQNIHDLTYIPFIQIADYVGYFGKSERDRFEVEDRCKPIVDAFIREGYCEKNDGNYNWTSKFRAVLESENVWETPEEIIAKEENQSSFEQKLFERMNVFIRENQGTGHSLLRDMEANLDLTDPNFQIENHFLPETSEKPDTENRIIFKWFGPK